MPLILTNPSRDKVNVRANELVVATNSNRPHQKLLQNTLDIRDYVNAMTLADLVDVGPDASSHSAQLSGDPTTNGAYTPTTILRQKTGGVGDDGKFMASTINERNVDMLRPVVMANGKLRIGRGNWKSFGDNTKAVLNQYSSSDEILVDAPPSATPGSFVYICMENNVLSPEISYADPSSTTLGVYICKVKVIDPGSGNVFTDADFVDQRAFLSPSAGNVTISTIAGYSQPWRDSHTIATGEDSGSLVITLVSGTYVPGDGTLFVFQNGKKLGPDQYSESGPNSITLAATLNRSVDDYIDIVNVVGFKNTGTTDFTGYKGVVLASTPGATITTDPSYAGKLILVTATGVTVQLHSMNDGENVTVRRSGDGTTVLVKPASGWYAEYGGLDGEFLSDDDSDTAELTFTAVTAGSNSVVAFSSGDGVWHIRDNTATIVKTKYYGFYEDPFTPLIKKDIVPGSAIVDIYLSTTQYSELISGLKVKFNGVSGNADDNLVIQAIDSNGNPITGSVYPTNGSFITGFVLQDTAKLGYGIYGEMKIPLPTDGNDFQPVMTSFSYRDSVGTHDNVNGGDTRMNGYSSQYSRYVKTTSAIYGVRIFFLNPATTFTGGNIEITKW